MSAPIHLHPTAPLAERVLLPGDPGRALLLAQTLLEAPKMFNHNRGLWGYTGTGPDGEPLSVQSTGMGGPSAAIVITELVQLGARRLVRVGTCGALVAELALGDLLIARAALTEDGASRALAGIERVGASPELLSALTTAGAGTAISGIVASTDLFYDDRGGIEQLFLTAGAIAVEMETATLFALAKRLSFQAASLLIVSDLLVPTRRRIEDEALRDAERRLGQLASRALIG